LPTNLPVQLTSFVGRDDEITRLTNAVGEHRLVTLTGVGGVGKTRLARQVAGDLVAELPDGAWESELAPAGDEDAMLSIVVSTFRVQPRTGLTLEARTASTLFRCGP
jgi:predicted ATPase